MFESHITIQPIPLEEFTTVCNRIAAKPLLIENDSGSNYLPQMMTAKFHNTQNFQTAYCEMLNLAANFKDVIRLKLENIISKNEEPKDYLYLEYHMKYEVNDFDKFSKLVRILGGHTSSNRLRSGCFVTVRTKEKYEEITRELKQYELKSVIRECVVFDNNPELDSGWYNCLGCKKKEIYNEEIEKIYL